MTVSRNTHGGGSDGGGLTRKVSFKEDYKRSPAPSSMVSYSSVDSEAQKVQCKPARCNRCCAFMAVAIGVLLVIAIIWAIIFYSFLVSNIPHFYLKALEVRKMNVTTDKNGDSALTALAIVHFNVTNNNGRISFTYGPMTANMALDGVSLGRSEVGPFQQGTHNTTKIEVWSHVEKMDIEEADGDDLIANSTRHQLTVDVSMLGNIEYRVKENMVSSCPFKVICQQAPQTVLDSGAGFECNVRMSPLR